MLKSRLLLCVIITYIIKQNEAVARVVVRRSGIVNGFHMVVDIIMVISLRKLREGGADRFKAMRINIQNVKLGLELRRPLNDRIFRVWC